MTHMTDHVYTFFEVIKKKGVGFSIRNSIALKLEHHPTSVNERIMNMRLVLPLGMDVYATIISGYDVVLTNSEENKEAVYNSFLGEVIRRMSRNDKLIPTDDFNARVGRETGK